MKKTVLFLFVLISALSLKAQITVDQIKTSLAGKDWKIVKYEVFGVADAPKAEQVNDHIFLKADMTFIIMENGKEYKGKWITMKPEDYITCKATNGSWTKTYRIISIGEKEAVIQFKDPDLVKTNYYLEIK